MMWLWNFVSSSIGKKLLMSLSGLFFCSFLVVHLSGNTLLFIGADEFNAYTTFMSTSNLIFGMEIMMIVLFLLHIYTSAVLTLENRAARPEKYKMDVSAGKRTIMSSNMFITGSIVVIFVVLHVWQFKYGNWSNTDPDSMTMYALVAFKLKSPLFAFGYVIAVIGVGFHLNHSFQSAFQTLGINHMKYTPLIKKLGTLFAILVAVGFASFPVYFYITPLVTGG